MLYSCDWLFWVLDWFASAYCWSSFLFELFRPLDNANGRSSGQENSASTTLTSPAAWASEVVYDKDEEEEGIELGGFYCEVFRWLEYSWALDVRQHIQRFCMIAMDYLNMGGVMLNIVEYK